MVILMLLMWIMQFTIRREKKMKMLLFISDKAVGQQSTIQVTTSGFVTFGERKYPFHQSFLITAKEDKWKVVSDVFRFQAVVS